MNDSDSEKSRFLRWLRSEFEQAAIEFHAGNADRWRRIWSQAEDVTVFGSWKTAIGPVELHALVDALESRFQACASFNLEVLQTEAHRGWAHTVAFEHTRATIEGEQRDYTLRVTQVYREEADGWKVVHRHGDTAPDS
jgi:ketosteroid isomerase-like protein